MALALNVISEYFEGKKLKVKIRITASGTYVTDGDTIDFTTVTGRTLHSSQVPTFGAITGVNGFVYGFVAGTTQKNCLMRVFVATTTGTNAPLQQHSAASYVSGVTGDTITLEAEFSIR